MKTALPLLIIASATLGLGACGKKTEAPAADAAPAASPSAADDPAAQPIEGEADSAWVEMMGTWAQTDACGDYTREWRLEAESFSLHEMHCAISRLELLANGVRALAQCTVEGDNDGVEDAYKFVRQGDFSLTVIQEANGAETTGLFPCEGEETAL